MSSNLHEPVPIFGQPVQSTHRPLLRLGIVLCAAGGFRFWEWIEPTPSVGALRWLLVLGVIALACLPPIATRVAGWIKNAEVQSPAMMNRSAIVIALFAMAYLTFTAFFQHRDLFPKVHDECSYAIGAQMLARGRLWMPALPLPDFFDSFYILVRPAYCSIYFIGGALLFAPGVWLHLPTWLIPVMVSGAAAGLVYRITAELVDRASGVLAVLLLLSSNWFRVFSTMLTGHIPVLLMCLALVWAWLRWRDTGRLRWAAVMGTAAGWGAILRPADAAIYALVVGVAVAASLLQNRSANSVRSITVMILAALPFLALQLAFDAGVTGRPLRSPYVYYLEQDMPGGQFGFHHPDAAMVPHTTLPEKNEFYSTWARPRIMHHTLANLPGMWRDQIAPIIVNTTLPCPQLLPLAFIGILGLTTLTRRLMAATLPLFCVVYAVNPFFLAHYAILLIPSVALLVVLGRRVLISGWPRFEKFIDSGTFALIAAVCVTSFPEINGWIAPHDNIATDEQLAGGNLRQITQRLARSIKEPAVVLFTFHPHTDFLQQPVYNYDVAWPDDARVIRAHDLGPARNQEIFDYYGRTQPDRVFYIYDNDRPPAGGKNPDPLVCLGRASDLASPFITRRKKMSDNAGRKPPAPEDAIERK